MPNTTTHQPQTLPALLAAGATLAALAEPHRDLLHFGGDFCELASTLKYLGDGLATAYERSAELRTKHQVDHAERQALATASRTAKRALIDLAAVIGAIERHQAATAGAPQ